LVKLVWRFLEVRVWLHDGGRISESSRARFFLASVLGFASSQTPNAQLPR
jgi:hypothetical protein